MVSSVNFRSLTEGSLDVQSFVYRENSSVNTALRSSSADHKGAGHTEKMYSLNALKVSLDKSVC